MASVSTLRRAVNRPGAGGARLAGRPHRGLATDRHRGAPVRLDHRSRRLRQRGVSAFDVAVGEPIAQLPAHSHRDHLRQEPNPAKLDLGAGSRERQRRITQSARASIGGRRGRTRSYRRGRSNRRSRPPGPRHLSFTATKTSPRGRCGNSWWISDTLCTPLSIGLV